VDGRDHQLHQLQMECEDIKQEKKQSSITASDMDREINRLKRVNSMNYLHMVKIVI
jgi:FtsZ-binding cell division protein ZapB